jgi:beta-glucosidase
LSCDASAIPRLGLPAYSHRNECLHGVFNGVATVFPEPIGMAATWNTLQLRRQPMAGRRQAKILN